MWDPGKHTANDFLLSRYFSTVMFGSEICFTYTFFLLSPAAPAFIILYLYCPYFDSLHGIFLALTHFSYSFSFVQQLDCISTSFIPWLHLIFWDFCFNTISFGDLSCFYIFLLFLLSHSFPIHLCEYGYLTNVFFIVVISALPCCYLFFRKSLLISSFLCWHPIIATYSSNITLASPQSYYVVPHFFHV